MGVLAVRYKKFIMPKVLVDNDDEIWKMRESVKEKVMEVKK